MARALQKVLFVRPRSVSARSGEMSGSSSEPDISTCEARAESAARNGPPKTKEDGEQDRTRGQEEGRGGLNSTQKKPRKSPPTTPPYKGGGLPGVPLDLGQDEKQAAGADVLLAAALRLPSSERKELLARLSLAENSKPGEGRDVDMWTGAVYSALVDAIGGSGDVGAGPLPLRRVLGASSCWGPVRGLMESSGLSELAVVRRQSVYNLFARLLVDHAKGAARRIGLPLTARYAAQHAPSLAAIVDCAFPGYARAGLLPLVADRLTNPKEGEDREDN